MRLNSSFRGKKNPHIQGLVTLQEEKKKKKSSYLSVGNISGKEIKILIQRMVISNIAGRHMSHAIQSKILSPLSKHGLPHTRELKGEILQRGALLINK